MKLVSFRVTNFRSVNDSGPINVTKVTTLVGRNESGKTNLLLALQSLNPPGGPKDLSPIKDFPRSRRISECTADTELITTTWEFDAKEQTELGQVFPRAKSCTTVEIGRNYKGASRWVKLPHLQELRFDHGEILAKFVNLKAEVAQVAGRMEATPKSQLETAIATAEPVISASGSPKTWAAGAKPALTSLRQTLKSTGAQLALDETATEILNVAETILGDEAAAAKVDAWVLGRLPVFVYVDEYPELEGHQNIDQYLERKRTNSTNDADRNFEKLCKVADLNPQQLKDLLSNNDHETRSQLANRAGAVVTSEIRRLWKDRPLKIRFNPDAAHLDTFISDPNAVYDVEVNLDERSRGFKWFFSFYITFSADTKGGSADNAILLLDEPGLYLHATSQGDLLKHFATDFKNQILYTTHSPFMVPTNNLDSIRTVNIDQDSGTTVTNDPSGDSRTLFPIQAALGFHLAQTLFVGGANLIVEGVTDFWIMSSISEYLRSAGPHGR